MMAWTRRSTRCSPSRGARRDTPIDDLVLAVEIALRQQVGELALLHRLDHRSAVLEHAEHRIVDRVDHVAALRDRVGDGGRVIAQSASDVCTIRPSTSGVIACAASHSDAAGSG